MKLCITCKINESMESLIVNGGLDCWYCLEKYNKESFERRKFAYENKIKTPILCDHTIPKPFLKMHQCKIPLQKIYGSNDNKTWYVAI